MDNCLQLEIVTVAGQRIVASPQEHEELFWALRELGRWDLAWLPRHRSNCTRYERNMSEVNDRCCYQGLMFTVKNEVSSNGCAK